MASSVLASDFYIDPKHGEASGDGSEAKPWRSPQETIDCGLVQSRGWDALPYNPERKLVPKNDGAPIKPGDTIWLRSGDHGEVTIRKHYVSPKWVGVVAYGCGNVSAVRQNQHPPLPGRGHQHASFG